MKAIIIGGGIAGLAAAISLKKVGWEVSVNERASHFTEIGLGFILLPNGLEALDQLGAGPAIRQYGKFLKDAILQNSHGEVYKKEDLSYSLAIRRYDCLQALETLLPKDCVHYGNEFSHFIYNEKGRATTVVFKNGERQTGDIFIAADGANSAIRKSMFPQFKTTATKVKELVCIADLPEIAEMLDGNLLKTQSDHMGLSFGMVPCNNEQIIWYMQYDCNRWDMPDLNPETKRKFAFNMMKGWPHPIQYVLNHSNMNKSFLWTTKDMDILPSFHHRNIVLIGDAAHLALPFTSQGTNSALQDAIVLSELLEGQRKDFSEIFTEYYYNRKDVLCKYLQFGRMIADRFLEPALFVDEEAPIPLAK